MMGYRITPHAQARIVERKVPVEWLQSVLNAPQQCLSGNYGREIRQSIFEVDGKHWLLRVILEADLILTVLLTSKIEKYRGEP